MCLVYALSCHHGLRGQNQYPSTGTYKSTCTWLVPHSTCLTPLRFVTPPRTLPLPLYVLDKLQRSQGKCRSGAACRFTHGASDTRELEGAGAGAAAGAAAAGGTAKTAAAEATATPPAAGPTSAKKPCKYFARG